MPSEGGRRSGLIAYANMGLEIIDCSLDDPARLFFFAYGFIRFVPIFTKSEFIVF